MKRRYQISRRRAVEKFRKLALAKPTPIQLTFPLAEIADLAQTSLGDLLRGVGRAFIEAVMESEVEELAGKRSQPNPHRKIYRWGSEEGYCLIDGQRVPIQRPRLRSRTKKEVPLGSYEMFQRSSLLGDTVWQKIMLGLTMRSYKEVVQQFADAYGWKRAPPVSTSSKPAGKAEATAGAFVGRNCDCGHDDGWDDFQRARI